MTTPAAREEGGGSTGRLHSLIDQLASEYAHGPHRNEIAAAREDYFTRSGKVFEDDGDLFEARLASFVEYYVIERALDGGPPPVLRALARRPPPDDETRLALTRLATSHRSVFDVAQVTDATVLLEDVIGGARFIVHERRSTVGFEAGALVEARLVWEGRRVVFAKTFLFHPRDAREEALAAVESQLKARLDRDEIMFHLARLHVRWHRQGHVWAARVYRGT